MLHVWHQNMQYVQNLITELNQEIKIGENLQITLEKVSQVPIFKFILASDNMIKKYFQIPKTFTFYTKIKEDPEV